MANGEGGNGENGGGSRFGNLFPSVMDAVQRMEDDVSLNEEGCRNAPPENLGVLAVDLTRNTNESIEISRIYPPPPPFVATAEPDFDEIDELDVNFSAGKRRWVFDSALMLGTQEEKVLPLQDINQEWGWPWAFPPNIPSPSAPMSRNIKDSFRLMSGKYWVNLGHGDAEKEDEFLAQTFHRTRRGGSQDRSLLFFHNPTNLLHRGSGMRLEPPNVNDYSNFVSRQSDWRNAREIMQSFFEENRKFNLPIYHETFKITWPERDSIPDSAFGGNIPGSENWSWRNYMYGLPGLIPNDYDERYAGDHAEAVYQARLAAATANPLYASFGEDSSLIWRNWNSAVYSKNLHPVIPFFGNANFDLDVEQYSDSSYRPPAKGKSFFFDHVTSVPDFFTKKELSEMDFSAGSYYHAQGVYNYYDCIYEDLICPSYPEQRLPNYYKHRPKNALRKIEGAFPEFTEMPSIRNDVTNERPASLQELIELNGIQNYGVLDEERYPTLETWSIFENPNSQEFQKVYNDRRIFPMYTEMELVSTETSEFAQSLLLGDSRDQMRKLLLPLAKTSSPTLGRLQKQDPGIVEIFRSKMVTQLIGTGEYSTDSVEFDADSAGVETLTSMSDIVERDLNYFKLEDWLSSMTEEEQAETVQERFRNIITNAILKAKIKDIVKEKYRKFKQVLAGKPAHSETVAYRVEKLTEGVPTQNYYFGTNDDVEIVRFLDSQVEYAKEYTYKVHAINVVIGTKYVYADCMNNAALRKFFDDSRENRPSQMFFGVIHRPSVLIMEVPMKERRISILDKPPMPPDVDIIPIRGVATRVMFFLNSSSGEMSAVPIPLMPEQDAEDFQQVARSQNPNFVLGRNPVTGNPVSPNEVLSFRSDDEVRSFDVFRIDEEPMSWSDFENSRIGQAGDETATSAGFVDTIRPNVKYYYTFRARDQHGHVSNPSHIYCVESVLEGGVSFLKMDLFNFKKEKRKTKMEFSNTLIIRPNELHKVFNGPADGTFETWKMEKKLGAETGFPFWGQKFKMRVTSKSTGKQIDINFKFNKKYSKIEKIQNSDENKRKC